MTNKKIIAEVFGKDVFEQMQFQDKIVEAINKARDEGWNKAIDKVAKTMIHPVMNRKREKLLKMKK
ncbi:MAG: hypothetical protein KAJ40_05700 [Alphaproteobacteria bacterium]|nr:hypothetical protein [Alphaproteobacteria bacterium]